MDGKETKEDTSWWPKYERGGLTYRIKPMNIFPDNLKDEDWKYFIAIHEQIMKQSSQKDGHS